MSVTVREAAERRAEAAGAGQQARATAPDGVQARRAAPMPAQMRAGTVQRDGKDFLQLDGFASVYEREYTMYDIFGPYDEVVSEGAGATSLAQEPDVVYLLNHTGIPFARSTSGTLELTEPGGGLWTQAYLNPKRQDAQDLVTAVDEGSITEMSFAFRIMDGRWSPDYLQYRIAEFDINRGDASPVSFGANPHTSIEARAAQFALTNDLLRAARAMDDEQRQLIAGAIAARGLDSEKPAGLHLGQRAIADLRMLRADVAQGAQLDGAARSTLTAVIDDLIGGGEHLCGDGPLDVLLGVTRMAPPSLPPAAPSVRIDFLEQELAAARRL